MKQAISGSEDLKSFTNKYCHVEIESQLNYALRMYILKYLGCLNLPVFVAQHSNLSV